MVGEHKRENLLVVYPLENDMNYKDVDFFISKMTRLFSKEDIGIR